MRGATYDKGEGTSGIRGQLYETKLLSLIFYRAKHDDTIEEFQLASNIAEIGAFDDICFKAKVKGYLKPLIVSIQAKHKDDSQQTLDIDMMKYFRSYLRIRERFESDQQHELYQGNLLETESFFVIYTSGKDTFGNVSVESDFASKLNDLIDTGGIAKQPYKQTADVKFLCDVFMKDQTILLAKQMAKFISGEKHVEIMLSDELMLLYHVVLTQAVFDLSEINPNGHRIATFQQVFFETNQEYLSLFRDTLFNEILKTRVVKPAETNNLLSEFLAAPNDATKLSKLVGTVITYNNGQLEFVKPFTKYFNQPLNQVHVSRLIVNEAIELAAKEILSKGVKVPAAFGNKDLMLSGSDAKKARRIKHLTSKLVDLLDRCNSSNMVTIDNSFDKGLLELNGGIAGAIGNMFVLDDNTKLMKITDKWESLGNLAQMLYKKLIDEIPHLHEFRFCFKVNKFPKLSFDCSQYEETLARDFLSNLLLYSKQADENRVEEILKDKIEEYQLDHPNYFQAKTDAMFLKYHDKIQKWWMQPKQAVYLTKESDVFENAINDIIKEPLMSSLNAIYMSKMKHFIDYTFTEDAVSSWNLQNQSSTVIITENSVLTVVKVMHHLKNKDHAVLDLEYIVSLPTNDRNALRTELTNTNDDKVIVFVCDKLQHSRNEIKTLEHIAKVVLTKRTIIITNALSLDKLQKYCPRVDSTVHDEKNSLLDMSAESQKSILETSRVMFQEVEVRLDLIVDEISKAYVKGDILNKIIINNAIKLGILSVKRGYDEIKHLYVDRWVQETGPTTNKPLDKSPPLKSLYDIEDDVVLVTAEPGMGKSTLLTHLSLSTKKEHPQVWIVRVNLLEYTRELSKWKKDETAVDLLETLKFMCQVILHEKLGKDNNVEIALEDQNGVVYLKYCTGDQLTEFELKLFLHYFNERNMIFLFDGFDEICPHYMNEAIKCIKAVSKHPNKHKIWVTSRSYTEVKTILQRAFGAPYEIEHFSYETKKEYLNKIWKFNLILEELNTSQLENVRDFLEFMSKSENCELQLFELPLHEIYINAGCYLINEIKDSCDSLWPFDRNYDDTYYKLEKELIFGNSVYEENSDKNPLHLFLRAHFFITSIKDVNKSNAKSWNRDVNTFTFYQQYLETKLKKIRFEDKNNMDTTNPDIIIVCDKELADFIAKHKKMAAYAIFNQDINTLFSKKDLEDITETIKFMERGGEKTGLIYTVANVVATEIPIFIHMTFAEYFAVEYVCDLLKNERDNDTLILWMEFIFNVIFSATNFANVRNIFDYKMKIDETLMIIIESNEEALFHLLMEQGIVYSEYLGNVNPHKKRPAKKIEHRKKRENLCYWPPFEAVLESLHNFISLFASTFVKYINESNLDEFLEIVNGTRLLPNAVKNDCDELVICVFDIIKKLDNSKLTSVLRQNFCYLSRSRTYDDLRSQEIIEIIRKDYRDEYNFLKTNCACPPSYAWLFQ